MCEGGCVCGGGEEKRKAGGVHGWWGKKRKGKKKWGVRFTCMVGKKGGVEKKEEKKN